MVTWRLTIMIRPTIKPGLSCSQEGWFTPLDSLAMQSCKDAKSWLLVQFKFNAEGFGQFARVL
jgi:hypothetical protein